MFLNKLHYDEKSGNLIWKVGTKYPGKVAGQIKTNKRGGNKYIWVGIGFDGKVYKILGHRIIWFIKTGAWPKADIDHKDGDGLNNRFSNLRSVDRETNNKNHKIQRNNKSGLAGVGYLSRLSKWRVYSSDSTQTRKQIHLGVYSDFFEACCIRKSFELNNGFTIRHGK